jgi:hypothetical protein
VEAWCDAVEAQRRPRQRVPGAVVAGQRRARTYNDFFLFFVLFVVRLNSGAWQRMFDIISRGCRQLLLFVVHRPWRTTKILNRAFFRKVHGKGTLPCKKRSCVLCRVPR